MTLNAIEKWGTTVDEAVALALADLNLTKDEVTVTVLEEPSRGFLGLIGNKLAKVRVERKVAVPEEPKEAAPAPKKFMGPICKEEVTEEERHIDREPRGERKERGNRRDRRNNGNKSRSKEGGNRREARAPREVAEDQVETNYTANIREKPENLVEIFETPALDFLKTLTEKMNLTVDVKAYQNDECIYIDINGKDSGTIIGKRGQTLDSIQYLTSLVVNKDVEKYVKVIVDAENYREKRERTLEQLANRLAGKVVRSGKSVRLEPMNPYERKVIHATLQKYPGVNTRSEGEEPYRRVIIERKLSKTAESIKAAEAAKAEAPAADEE
ncbi:MAG: protein jag [Clostridiales bacterium]|nr:protein jag [Clostridiales bacterium]